ncbi:hypothetical protein PC116_g24886 [Phytophthora cactorum]|uniref:Uncharacterized protein n=1 Tax=Phytophthora cactorum TaxID=29920 RepID=A0A8T1E2G9_9STRA|nr:hypothetical protein PC114_g8337 [Phytophthora cactorum]KAG2945726.1 hypothetical protein PC117_g8198 [Phytophthora cactorum]KAG3024882.1 hypothetical protein PC120_g6790 [Phytophthora cactorum]KAG3193986.1 hypothetical protein PC128_g9749 [Phytophthora cactorum]KAG4226706.1 hypothetical protein PC116_g24886 [Phytophthora cactorum]
MTLEQFIEDKSNRTKEACPLLAEFQYCCGPGKLPKTMSTSSRTSFGGEPFNSKLCASDRKSNVDFDWTLRIPEAGNPDV